MLNKKLKERLTSIHQHRVVTGSRFLLRKKKLNTVADIKDIINKKDEKRKTKDERRKTKKLVNSAFYSIHTPASLILGESARFL